MVNADNLRVGAERVDESWLKERFDKIKQEITDAWKNPIEIQTEWLNWQFAEYLQKNPEVLKLLKDDVNRLSKSKAWKGLEELATFLDDIDNFDRMKKDFDEFMKKIENPQKLNTMKSWEIRRLNLYIWMNIEDAMKAYKAMQPLVDNFPDNMKSEDKKFFESIWDSLKARYATDDVFTDKVINDDYPKLKDLDSTVAKLKAFFGTNWDGSSENIQIEENKKSIVSLEKVQNKVKEANEKRIEGNKAEIWGISLIDKVDKAKFKNKSWKLYYKADTSATEVEFNADKMKELFENEILDLVKWSKCDFVNDEERDKMISSCSDAIFSNLEDKLRRVITPEPETPTPTTPTTPENPSSGIEYSASQDIIKIKDLALKEKIVKLKFCESLEGEVKFNMAEVRNYIDGIKNKPWKEFKKLSKIDKETGIIAVQIALMYLNKSEWECNGKCDVQWLDWIRWWRTIKWIKWFQEAKSLKVDGAPWPKTLNAIFDALGGTSSVETPTEQPTVTPAETPTEQPTELVH